MNTKNKTAVFFLKKLHKSKSTLDSFSATGVVVAVHGVQNDLVCGQFIVLFPEEAHSTAMGALTKISIVPNLFLAEKVICLLEIQFIEKVFCELFVDLGNVHF
jgi:hypothetical protein